MIKQITLFVSLLVIFALPQATFAQSLTATLTGPEGGTVNQPVRFSATSSGKNLSKMQIFAAKTNADLSKSQSWTLVAQNTSCQGNSCNTEGSFTPSEITSYYVVINATDSSSTCSGNPLLLQKSLPGWLNCGEDSRLTFTAQMPNLPPAQNLQTSCSADGTIVTATWNPIAEATFYTIRVDAPPYNSADPKIAWWHPVGLGTYSSGDPQIAPSPTDPNSKGDFIADTQGNTSTTYKAKIATGVQYSLSIQGRRQSGEAGQYAGVDFACIPPTATPTQAPASPAQSPEYTTKYQISYDSLPTDWSTIKEYAYAGNVKVSHTFSTTPGDKFIFVKFKTNKGKEEIRQLKVVLVNTATPATTPSPSDSPEYTTFYQIAYDNLPDWSTIAENTYTDNIKVTHTFTNTSGDKFVFVKFKTNKGRETIHQLKVVLISPSSRATQANNPQVPVSAYDTFILGNKLTKTFLDQEGRYAYYQELEIVNNQVQYNSQAPWNRLDLDNLRGQGGERYTGYGTYIVGSNFYQTFIDKAGKYAYSRTVPILDNRVTNSTNIGWQMLDLDNLRGAGNERYSDYTSYIIGNTFNQVFLDQEGSKAYSRELNIVNGQIQKGNDVSWIQIDLDKLRARAGGEKYSGYSTYVVNNRFVQTFISQDGKTAYTSVLKINNNQIQSGTNVAWLSQPISNPTLGVNPTTLVNTADYFNFKPGDYWIFEGGGDKVRMDVENLTPISLQYNGKSITANTYPLRTTANRDNSQGGTWTTFLTSDFNFNNQPIKYSLKTDIYNTGQSPLIDSKTMCANYDTNKNRTKCVWYAFFPTTDSPGYYFSRLDQDLTQDEIHPFVTAKIPDLNFFDGNIGSYTLYNTGWNTAYNLVNVNFPGYKGEALRIRFWEYDPGGELEHAGAYNYDEWFLAKNIGVVGINNKVYRKEAGGTECSQDPDCSDQTVTMQSPMFSVGLVNYGHFENNESISVQVGKNNSFGSSVSVNNREEYQIKVTTKKGSNYTGFVEIQGILNSSGQRKDIQRSVLKANNQPIWVENGIANLNSAITSQKGLLTASFRPYIYNEKGVELGPNRLGWSNRIAIETK